jgi:hypothetical protein
MNRLTATLSMGADSTQLLSSIPIHKRKRFAWRIRTHAKMATYS